MLKKIFFIFMMSIFVNTMSHSQIVIKPLPNPTEVLFACTCPLGHTLDDKRCKPSGDYLECTGTPSNGVWGVSGCTCPQTGRKLEGKICIDIPGYLDCVNGTIKGSWINNRCECTIAGTQLDGTKCVKIPGYDDCINGTIKGTWTNNACICPFGTRLGSLGKCEDIPEYKACTLSPSNGTWVNNACVCKAGTKLDRKDGKCKPLNCNLETQYVNGNECADIVGYKSCTDSGGKCNTSTTLNGMVVCTCRICPAGKRTNAAGTACETFTCPSGQYVNGNICSVITGWADCVNSGGSCTSTSSNPCVCKGCKTGYTIVSNKCVIKTGYSECTSSGGSWNDSTNTCTCSAADRYYSSSTKKCTAIPKYSACLSSGGTWTGAKKSGTSTTSTSSGSTTVNRPTTGTSAGNIFSRPSVSVSAGSSVAAGGGFAVNNGNAISTTTATSEVGKCTCGKTGSTLNSSGSCTCQYGEKNSSACYTEAEAKQNWCTNTMRSYWDSAAGKCKFEIIRSGKKAGTILANNKNCGTEASNWVYEGEKFNCYDAQGIQVSSTCSQNGGKGCFIKYNNGTTTRRVFHGGYITPPTYPNTAIQSASDQSSWQELWY